MPTKTGQKRPLLNVILPKAMMVEAIDLFFIAPAWLNSSFNCIENYIFSD
ncbi:hypothetical protein J522_3116 [Acinetobacter baumannii 146457]|nr:hypothetical protein J522_3116 [Acinetobacter baumannii 146457]